MKLWGPALTVLLAAFSWSLPSHFYVPSVAFSADGHLLAFAGSVGPPYEVCGEPVCEGLLHVWDLRSGQRVFANQSTFARVMSLAITHDSQRIITGHSDGSVMVWDSTTFRVVQTFHCCARTWIRALAVSPDDRVLAVGAQSGEIVFLSLAGDAPARPLPGHLYGVSSLEFDASGDYLMSTGDDQHVYRWNVRTSNHYEFSRSPAQGKAHRGMVKTVATVNGGKWAVTGAYWEGGTTKDYTGFAPPDSILRLWDVDTGRPLRAYPLNWGVRCCIKPLAGGHQIAYLRTQGWDENPLFEILDLDSGKVEHEVAPTMGESFHAMAMHPDSMRFVIDIGGGQSILWDRKTGKELAQLVSVDEGWAVVATDGRIDFSDGFSRWPCRNNIQQACSGGAAATPTRGLLASLIGSR